MIVEALAQTASVMVAATIPDLTEGKLVFFTTVEKARFRQPVRPGDVVNFMWPRIQEKGRCGNLLERRRLMVSWLPKLILVQ